jgi:uncharacterized membrane protein YdbT with pleckstrin-like domain
MADEPVRFHPQAPKELDRYLIPTESIIFMIHRHWLVLTEPVLTTIGGLLVVGIVDSSMGGTVAKIFVVLWLFLLGRMLWKIYSWWETLFLATDRRLILLHGIFTRRVDMMPLSKVTDMRYDRSTAGRFLGFGVYVLESAGQDQALSRVTYVPDPDKYYRALSAVIFAPPSRRLSDKLVPSSSGSKLPISEPETAWWKR